MEQFHHWRAFSYASHLRSFRNKHTEIRQPISIFLVWDIPVKQIREKKKKGLWCPCWSKKIGSKRNCNFLSSYTVLTSLTENLIKCSISIICSQSTFTSPVFLKVFLHKVKLLRKSKQILCKPEAGILSLNRLTEAFLFFSVPLLGSQQIRWDKTACEEVWTRARNTQCFSYYQKKYFLVLESWGTKCFSGEGCLDISFIGYLWGISIGHL